MSDETEPTDDKPDTYDELVNEFHDRLAARVGAALERLRALEDELEEIQLDIESGPWRAERLDDADTE